LAAVVTGRLVLHVLLYASGFESLTADEFARVVTAARWAEHPYWQTHGDWLPLHPYLYGAVLKLWWNLLWAPRGLTILFGVVAIVGMALLTRMALGSWRCGLVGATLLAINPGHLWLSATPLTEGPYTAFVVGAVAALLRHLRRGGPAMVLLSGALLGLACGLRYEGWMLAMPYTGLLLHRAVRRSAPGGDCAALVVAAALPWVVPVLWLTGHWLATDDPLHFLHSIRQYKLTWYGGAQSYASYLRTFFRLDPFATVLAPVGCVLALRAARRDGALFALVLLCVIPFVVFVGLHRGQVESINNSVRYLGPFLFLTYPLVVVALETIGRSIIRGRGKGYRFWCAALAFIAAGWQLHTAFGFVPDGNAVGLRIGQRLHELRAADGREPPRPAVIELTYWTYLAIHVGANDVDRILYDRAIDLQHRQTRSLIYWDWPALRACLRQYDVGYIAVRTPELSAVLHKRLGVESGVTVGEWEILTVPSPEGGEAASPASAACPLSLPAG
jgi:hypothetical protein